MDTELRRECQARVFGERVHSWQCSRKGTVEREGKWYCKQHDPERNTPKAGAPSIWTFSEYDTHPVKWTVIRRSEVEVVALREGHRYPSRFRPGRGKPFFENELEAWRYRVRLEVKTIARAEQDLKEAHRLKAQAMEKVAALEKEERE